MSIAKAARQKLIARSTHATLSGTQAVAGSSDGIRMRKRAHAFVVSINS